MKWSSSRQSERGVLSVEGAITFPVIILLLFGTVDLGIVLDKYFSLSRVAYEGARVAASFSGLAPGDYKRQCRYGYDNTTSTYHCDLSTDYMHKQLQEKITNLMTENGFDDLSHFNLQTSYKEQAGSDGNLNSDSNYVTVTVGIPIPLLTTIIAPEFTIQVQSSAPYLFRPEQTP